MTPEAERFNGWAAMLGFVAAVGAYATTCLLYTSDAADEEDSVDLGGRQNMYPSETRPYIDESASYEGDPQNAEKVNGRWAMIGFVALLGAYITTGQIIPGIF